MAKKKSMRFMYDEGLFALYNRAEKNYIESGMTSSVPPEQKQSPAYQFKNNLAAAKYQYLKKEMSRRHIAMKDN